MSNYKKPPKELNWKEIVKTIALSLIHLIGAASCFGSAFFMFMAACSFIVFGGIIFYKFNMIISVLEFFMTLIAMIYSAYLIMKVLRVIR